MLAVSLESIDAALLAAVCQGAWPESPSLEFKRDAPGNSDRDKHELLKDVCALANTDGGDLVFGIDEADGSAMGLAPISLETPDTLARRISQTLDAGIEPRILGVRTRQIDVEGGYVLVVRVPASFHGPHGIKVNNSRRFVMRNGTATSDLTFDQLRSAFDRTASLRDHARDLIRARNDSLVRWQSPKPLLRGPIRALHLVPLAGLAGRQAPDLHAVHGQSFTRLIEADWGGANRTFNLDGVVVYPGDVAGNGHYSYVQVFRSGTFEAASLAGGTWQQRPDAPKRSIVWSLEMSKWFHERTTTFLALARDLGLSGPAVVSFSVLHATTVRLNDRRRAREQALARASGRFRLVPI